jgi:hypothetical protein
MMRPRQEAVKERGRGHRHLAGPGIARHQRPLSPLHIRLAGDPKRTLEQFWQEEKCLAVWNDEAE